MYADATWLRNGATPGEVWHTYSDIASDPTSALPLPPTVRTHYILASNLSAPYAFTFQDSTEPRPSPFGSRLNALGSLVDVDVAAPQVFSVFEHNDTALTARAKWDASTPLSLPRCAGPAGDPYRSPFLFYTAAPLLPNNFALLGESLKFLSVTPQRFTNLYVSADGFSVIVKGSAGERVTVRAQTPSGAVLTTTCNFPGLEHALSQEERVQLWSAEGVHAWLEANELRMRVVCRAASCVC